MYATIADVEKYNPARAPFTGSSKPNASQVAGLIADASTEADGILTLSGYDVPVLESASVAHGFIGVHVSKLAAALVEEVAPTGDPKRREAYEKMAESARKALACGEVPGLPKATGQASVRHPFGATPVVSKAMEF